MYVRHDTTREGKSVLFMYKLFNYYGTVCFFYGYHLLNLSSQNADHFKYNWFQKKTKQKKTFGIWLEVHVAKGFGRLSEYIIKHGSVMLEWHSY